MHPWARILTVALALSVLVGIAVYFYSPPAQVCPERTMISMHYERPLESDRLRAALEERGFEWQPGVANTADIVAPAENEQFVEGEYEVGPTAAGGNGSVITFVEEVEAADNPGGDSSVETVAKEVARIVNATFSQEEAQIASWVRTERAVEC